MRSLLYCVPAPLNAALCFYQIKVFMKYRELEPLIFKVNDLKNNDDALDIYEFVLQKVNVSNSPSMAQSACEHVISMCHPRAWGDRYVAGYNGITDWCKYLSELSIIAQECWNKISENNGARHL